jgi:hypothetical protein
VLAVLAAVAALGLVASAVAGSRSGVRHAPTTGAHTVAHTTNSPTQAAGPAIPGDDSKFVADVTIPDGTAVRVNQRFVKTWELQNTGTVPWRGRYLERQGTLEGPGLCATPARVRIPDTDPDRRVQVSVPVTAPSLPGSCRVDWKMVDGAGRLLFPNKVGVYFTVNVVE